MKKLFKIKVLILKSVTKNVKIIDFYRLKFHTFHAQNILFLFDFF